MGITTGFSQMPGEKGIEGKIDSANEALKEKMAQKAIKQTESDLEAMEDNDEYLRSLGLLEIFQKYRKDLKTNFLIMEDEIISTLKNMIEGWTTDNHEINPKEIAERIIKDKLKKSA